jgi:hypothetical protein
MMINDIRVNIDDTVGDGKLITNNFMMELCKRNRKKDVYIIHGSVHLTKKAIA